MDRNDITPPEFAPRLGDLWIAFGLLSRLPLPYPAFNTSDPRPAAHAAWAYPMVGLVLACLTALGVWAALALGLPAEIAALLGLVIGVLCSGAMHEDGLADCADGFWGGWTKERRLEIMKDSQIGTYGVIALVSGLGLRWLCLVGLIGADAYIAALMGAAVISRAAMVVLMAYLPNARSTGLSHQTGRPPKAAMGTAVGLGLLACLLVTPAPVGVVLPLCALTLLGIAQIARSKIGGQTGDVLGAAQQLVEITILLACLASLT